MGPRSRETKKVDRSDNRRIMELGLAKGLLTTAGAMGSILISFLFSFIAFVITGSYWLSPIHLIVICLILLVGIVFYFSFLYLYTRPTPQAAEEQEQELKKVRQLGHRLRKGICSQCGVSPTAPSKFDMRAATRYARPAYGRQRQEAAYVTSMSDGRRWVCDSYF